MPLVALSDCLTVQVLDEHRTGFLNVVPSAVHYWVERELGTGIEVESVTVPRYLLAVGP